MKEGLGGNIRCGMFTDAPTPHIVVPTSRLAVPRENHWVFPAGFASACGVH